MSSSIYQGLQSRLMEPRVLRLKLNPSKSISSTPPPPPEEQNSDLSATHSNPKIQTHLKMEENHTAVAGVSSAVNRVSLNGSGNGVGGWSFLQAPSGVDGTPPAMKYSPTMALSRKSLEMCTESLGSETGSDGSDIGGDEKMSLFSSDKTEISPPSASVGKSVKFSRLAKKLAKPSYPPPLTSMCGSMSVKVKPHREGGRLVLKAVSIPSTKPCFVVERGGGRLRLRLLEHCLLLSHLEEVEEEAVEEKGEREEEGGGERRRKGRRCKEGGGGRKELVNWNQPFLVST